MKRRKMPRDNKNNSRMKSAEFQGYVWATLENFKEDLKEIKEDVKSLNRRVTGIQIKVAGIGAGASLAVTLLILLLKEIILK